MKRFNIRVYGVCISEQNEVLVSDETHNGCEFTKFPGGGLEWGEGTKDCLAREMQEEFGLEVEVNDLFYLTDFFQISAFSEHDQVISVYYRFTLNDDISNANFQGEKEECLRWIPLNELQEDVFMFPIDKLVAKQLTDKRSVRNLLP